VTVGTATAHEGDVVKVQTKSEAIMLPKTSATPVVMVAVNFVLGARLVDGTKVATLVEEV
jgi:hypothetical protein